LRPAGALPLPQLPAVPAVPAGVRRLLRYGRALVGHAALATLVASGALVAVSSAGNHGFLDPAARRGVRSWMDGPFAGLLTRPTLGQFHVELAVMTGAYLVMLACWRSLRAPPVITAILLLTAAFMLSPPLLSTDVFNYIAYARMVVVHHVDPYTVVPADLPHDPVFLFTHWRHTPDAYGPLFTLGTAPFGYLSVAGAMWGFKALAGLSSLGCVALIWNIARRLGRPPVRAIAIFGLNPMLLLWAIGGAHNDMLMLAGMLGGIALVLAKRETLGGAAFVAGVAIKATAGLAIPFAALAARRRGWRVVAGAAVAAAVMVVVAHFAFPREALAPIRRIFSEHDLVAIYGVPNNVGQLFGVPAPTATVHLICNVLLGVALLWLAVHVWRGGDWVTALGWGFLAVLMTSPWLLVWYTAWPLAPAAVSRDRRLLLATFAFSVYAIVNEVSLF
jgi:alpha-1,6-mannosyltransferase